MRSPVQTMVPLVAVGGVSPWLPLDTDQRPFQATLDVSLDAGTAGAAQVQYTPDNPNDMTQRFGGLRITRAAGVATITTLLAQPLSAGDSVVVTGSGDPNLDGTYPVVAATLNTLTYAVGNTGALAGTGNERVAFLRTYAVPGMAAVTARGDGVLNMPVRAVRLAVTQAGAGFARLAVSQGYGRG